MMFDNFVVYLENDRFGGFCFFYVGFWFSLIGL